MKRSEVNKKMKELEKVGLLDNFNKPQLKCLRELIKNQQEFIIVENDRQETEKSLFKAKQMPL
jgi:Lhr-like helicase